MTRSTSLPASTQRASVPAQATSASSGCAKTASARDGTSSSRSTDTWPRARRMPLWGGRLRQQSGFLFEVPEILESLVHTGEADVGHLVEFFQMFEHGDTDLFGGHLAPEHANLIFDSRSERLDRLVVDRAVLAGGADPGDELLPLKRFALLGTLDDDRHRRSDSFEGGEPEAAPPALSPAPHRLAAVRLARVDDMVVGTRTVRATHAGRVPPCQGGARFETSSRVREL